MNLLVGCPILHREWILEEWWAHLEAASTPVGISPQLVFAGDRAADPATFEVIDRLPAPVTIVETTEAKADDRRDWGLRKQRFGYMADVRNQLLGEVRRQAPDLFFSLDSDILIHPDTIGSLIDALDHHEWGAVGARCYLFPKGTVHVSYGMWVRNGGIRRQDQANGLFPVDVIMAAKMMRPAAYHVDYAYHHHGEDCGWSKNCKLAGVRLGWDGRTCSKHIYDRTELLAVDKRVGF